MEKFNNFMSMKIIKDFIGIILELFGLEPNTRIYNIIQFFFYDTIKIFILLFIFVMIISFIQTYFTPERSQKILGKYNGFGSKIMGALLGTVTPFCSCSSIPIFIGFTSSGLPIGTTFSFLISSPMVDLGSLLLLFSVFGYKVALLYTLFGLIIAIMGGTIIEKLKMENEINEFIFQSKKHDVYIENLTFKERINEAFEKTLFTIKKVYIYILVGVLIGSFIHNEIPSRIIENLLGKNNYLGVLCATLVGIPIYGDIFGVVPIGESLLNKGASMGVVLAFMMAVTTLSLPSLIMLSRVIKKRLLIVFILICFIGILSVGYLFNLIF